MENEIAYEETLARLYMLRDQLDAETWEAFSECEDAPDGPCQDCARHSRRWEYGKLRLCKVCCLGRLKVRALISRAPDLSCSS